MKSKFAGNDVLVGGAACEGLGSHIGLVKTVGGGVDSVSSCLKQPKT